MSKALESVIIEPTSGEVQGSLIFCHGLGGNAHEWSDIWKAFDLPLAANTVRLIAPHAPVRACSANRGLPTNSWFDFQGLSDVTDERLFSMKELEASVEAIHQLIQAEIDKGVPQERIVLGGFSQGAAVAMRAALAFPHTLGGTFMISGFLPLVGDFLVTPEALKTPYWAGFAEQDQHFDAGYMAAVLETIRPQGFESLDIKSYVGRDHTDVIESMNFLIDIGDFLNHSWSLS